MAELAVNDHTGSQLQNEAAEPGLELDKLSQDINERRRLILKDQLATLLLMKEGLNTQWTHQYSIQELEERIFSEIGDPPSVESQDISPHSEGSHDLSNQNLGLLPASQAWQDSSASSQHMGLKQNDHPRRKLQRLKRGIPGYVNGKRIAAFPDTGSLHNVVSAAFVKERGLHVRESEEVFKLGNSAITKSAGIVDLVWAFVEDPSKVTKIICHVLPTCQYDVILGHQFLRASETLTKFRRRITECMFTMINVLHLNLLGSSQEYLRGSLWEGDDGLEIRASAALDTGAEGNILDLDYAKRQGFTIHDQPWDRKTIQYADGSYEETVGVVRTRWAFESGLEIPVVFEVVENCIQNIVLGEDIVYGYDVYTSQAESIAASFDEDTSWGLATFSFVNKWQKKLRDIKIFRKRSKNGDQGEEIHETAKDEEYQERRRRDLWNYRYGFGGAKATESERRVERQRRRLYDAAHGPLPTRPPELPAS